jgi:hypothetical protein
MSPAVVKDVLRRDPFCNYDGLDPLPARRIWDPDNGDVADPWHPGDHGFHCARVDGDAGRIDEAALSADKEQVPALVNPTKVARVKTVPVNRRPGWYVAKISACQRRGPDDDFPNLPRREGVAASICNDDGPAADWPTD